MARVYLAVQTSLERRVALKVMAPALAADPSFSKRFLREARTIAALTHPNIVAIYEVGVTAEQLHYFSMQYLPGGDLAQRMRRGIEPAEIVRVLCGIAKALGFAHQQEVVHRDVTPGNVMFDASDTPVLTDFGIARALSGSSRITSTGVSIGTSSYMSPEQARGGDIDARSDLYSLGVLAFEALTGKTPYQGVDGFAVAYAHVFEPIPRLPGEFRAWQPFIDKALAKDPRDRFQSAEDMIEALQAIPLAGKAAAALPVRSGATTGFIDRIAAAKPARAAGAARQSMARWVLALVLFGGLAAVGYGVYLQLAAPSPAPIASPSPAPPAATPAPPVPAAAATEATATTATIDIPPGTVADGGAGSSVVPDDLLEPESDPALLPNPADYGPILPAERVRALLDFGQQLLRSQRLLLPAEANAVLMFSRVLEIEPGNAQAIAGLAAVVDAYLVLARTEFDGGRIDSGRSYLERARQVAATPGLDRAVLEQRLDAEWRGRIEGPLLRARAAIEAWKGGEAEAAVREVLAYEPDNAEAKALLKKAQAIGKPGWIFRDSASAPEMVIVGSGEVLLRGARRGGDVRVPIALPFAVSRGEITRAEFSRFVEATRHRLTDAPCRDRGGFFSASRERTWQAPGFKQGEDHPVVCVGHADAVAYAEWLSRSTGQRYRLPSEAEWQYLAAQVKSRPCATGNRADQSYRSAEGGSKAQSCNDGHAYTAPSRRLEATAPGVYDLEGNVREWVADCANDSHAGRPADQSARTQGNCGERMVMGTAWHSGSDEAAVIVRRSEPRERLDNTIGFRVVREFPGRTD
jgi:formylglycine-generating enzyme required for sulfatase activity